MGDRFDVSVEIDESRCSGCGLCIKVCPSDTISIVEGRAKVTGDRSLSCGHCMAVCPESAIKITSLDQDALRFNRFDLETKWLPYGEPDIGSLARLLASRRSCRHFKHKPVDRETISDLVRLGRLAPSGSNCQQWTFTCLTSREAVVQMAYAVGTFYKKLNRSARNPLLRGALRLVGKPELDNYYNNYHDKIENAINEMENNGRDLLFHGAPACIIVASTPEASCPGEDALLATQNILLAAHAMGIGTCLVGYAVKACERDGSIKKKIGMSEEEVIYSVIALGYPDERYLRVTGRKAALERYI